MADSSGIEALARAATDQLRHGTPRALGALDAPAFSDGA